MCGMMKDFLEVNYPENLSYDQLKAGLQAAWAAISEDWLIELLSQMPQRCKDVVVVVFDAEGRFTKRYYVDSLNKLASI